MENVPFKPRAYEKAAQAIESYGQPLMQVYEKGGVKALCDIPGIGKSMADKLKELVTTGRCALHEEYPQRLPVDVAALTALEGIGPKAVKVLFERLSVRTLADLEAAARAGKIRDLPRFGERSEQRILKGLAFVARGPARAPARSSAARRGARRHRPPLPGVTRVENRRLDPPPARDGGRRRPAGHRAHGGAGRRGLHEPGAGGARSRPRRHEGSVKLASGLQVDLRVVPEESFGAALLYFTGSKSHNVRLRQLAIKKGLKLNEYGLFAARGGSRAAPRTRSTRARARLHPAGAARGPGRDRGGRARARCPS
jgi:DNA polymerase (family 10)